MPKGNQAIPPFTIEVNDGGKLIVTNTKTGKKYPLYATINEVKALGKDWYNHLVIHNGEYGEYMTLKAPFNFRLPKITDLTVEQQSAIVEPGPIAVSGGPGTGKSIVALWRHIENHDTQRRKTLLLTYTKSLEAYLRASARNYNKDASDSVDRTLNWTAYNKKSSRGVYGEIIIDEAQDVEEERYQIINQCTSMVSYSADDNQMLYPDKGVSEYQLKSLFTRNNTYPLHENFRNTHEIVQFVKSMFPSRLISSGKKSGPKPTVICSGNSEEKQVQIVVDIINEFRSNNGHNIAVLVPLQKQVNEWHEKLRNNAVTCSKFVTNDVSIGTIQNVHVTTFKSAKGLEFDTVILPDFDNYQSNINNLYIVDENDYYVVFTRARRNLMLIDNSWNYNNRCELQFLTLPIQRGIVTIDLDYLNNSSSSSSATTRSSISDDDLPF